MSRDNPSDGVREPNTEESLLRLLLRVGGTLTSSAFFAMLLPMETMASIHRALGLGDLPQAPITGYLTRSLSAMYAMHGVLLFALSGDVRRHRPVIRILGWATAGLGICVFLIDLQAPMPAWWTAGEGPPVFVLGLLLAYLAGRLEP